VLISEWRKKNQFIFCCFSIIICSDREKQKKKKKEKKKKKKSIIVTTISKIPFLEKKHVDISHGHCQCAFKAFYSFLLVNT
jgi:hypothetical protein